MADAELELYRQQFEEVKAQAGELTAGLNEEQFNWRPAPEEWSIEECLGHLIIVGQWQVRAMERAIEEGKARGRHGSGPFRYGWLDRYALGLVEPESSRKFRAPRRFCPLHGQPTTAIVPTFLHLQSQFLLLVERAAGLDLARVKVATAITRFYKMSLGMSFAIAAAHERRHMEQARRVREQLPQLAGTG